MSSERGGRFGRDGAVPCMCSIVWQLTSAHIVIGPANITTAAVPPAEYLLSRLSCIICVLSSARFREGGSARSTFFLPSFLPSYMSAVAYLSQIGPRLGRGKAPLVPPFSAQCESETETRRRSLRASLSGRRALAPSRLFLQPSYAVNVCRFW